MSISTQPPRLLRILKEVLIQLFTLDISFHGRSMEPEAYAAVTFHNMRMTHGDLSSAMGHDQRSFLCDS